MTNQLNHDEIRNNKLDEIRNSGLKENNALRVRNYLKANRSERVRRLPRWIWELLQNAHDASTVDEDPLIVNIEYNAKELIFLHNGGSFEVKQIFNLIYHGSTKADQEEAIGEFGSGFLATHLLSPEIKVAGQLDNGQWFNFHLARGSDSQDSLLQLMMDDAWEDFKASLSADYPLMPDGFTTRFVYPIIEANAKEAVEKGIETLKQCAPYVVVFNPKFSKITINNFNEELCFEVIERGAMNESAIQQIKVATRKNGNFSENKYILVHGEKKTSVAVPLKSNRNNSVCQSVENIPRLFKAVPLTGTEVFSFPAVINSLAFKPTENRDDLFIGLGDDEANTENQLVIKESCTLLVLLLQYATSKGWHSVHQWTEIPNIQHPAEETREWLRTCIREKFIEKLQKTPIVLNADGIAIDPEKVKFLLAKSEIDVQTLWDLYASIKGQREFLPKREEAPGWCNAIRSWADVYQDEPMSLFSEVRNGVKLASAIQKRTYKNNNCGKIEHLQRLLQEDVPAVKWLNQLHCFYNENEMREAVREYRIVIDQAGYLQKLSALHPDPGIDSELKGIAEKLDWEIRQELRDIRLTSLTEEEGKGDMNQDKVVATLCEKLRTRADENPDSDFKAASTRLFSWIVTWIDNQEDWDQEDWDHLKGFPMFTDSSKSNTSPILPLPSAHTIKPPLAPIRAWPEDLKTFADIFPSECVLADAFFEALPIPEIWKRLDDQNLIRMNMTIHREETDLKLLSPDPEVYEDKERDHKATQSIPVTDVVELKKILKRCGI